MPVLISDCFGNLLLLVLAIRMYFQSFLWGFTDKAKDKVYTEAYESHIVYLYYTNVIMYLTIIQTIKIIKLGVKCSSND